MFYDVYFIKVLFVTNWLNIVTIRFYLLDKPFECGRIKMWIWFGSVFKYKSMNV